jgi:hypothetical protein
MFILMVCHFAYAPQQALLAHKNLLDRYYRYHKLAV